MEQLRSEKIRNDTAQINEKIAIRNDRYLTWGTWAVAVGAIALVVWEMIKTFYLEKH
jgi:hypothetical protein